MRTLPPSSPKKSRCTIFANLPVPKIAFTASSVVLYHHLCMLYCAALFCTATPSVLCCNLCCVYEIFLVCMSAKCYFGSNFKNSLLYNRYTWNVWNKKKWDNTNLILIWPHRHFQQKVKWQFCQKYWCWSPA